MELTLSGNQLLISKKDLDLFRLIQSKSIRLDLKYDQQESTDVLKDKKIDEKCPDITKLGNVKTAIENDNKRKVKVNRIILELV